MGRHKQLNPFTGRMIYKTGALAKKNKAILCGKTKACKLAQGKTKAAKNVNSKTTLQMKRAAEQKALKEAANMKAKKAAEQKKVKEATKKARAPTTPEKKKGGPVPGKFYGFAGATKFASPITKKAGKTLNFATRPSARAYFDEGFRGCVMYGGKLHMMAQRDNGSPYWKPVK